MERSSVPELHAPSAAAVQPHQSILLKRSLSDLIEAAQLSCHTSEHWRAGGAGRQHHLGQDLFTNTEEPSRHGFGKGNVPFAGWSSHGKLCSSNTAESTKSSKSELRQAGRAHDGRTLPEMLRESKFLESSPEDPLAGTSDFWLHRSYYRVLNAYVYNMKTERH